jgi:hypothetical protein
VPAWLFGRIVPRIRYALHHDHRGEEQKMKTLVILAALATAGALVLGLSSMARGGPEEARRSARMMGARVALQGLALILLLLALAFG